MFRPFRHHHQIKFILKSCLKGLRDTHSVYNEKKNDLTLEKQNDTNLSSRRCDGSGITKRVRIGKQIESKHSGGMFAAGRQQQAWLTLLSATSRSSRRVTLRRSIGTTLLGHRSAGAAEPGIINGELWASYPCSLTDLSCYYLEDSELLIQTVLLLDYRT